MTNRCGSCKHKLTKKCDICSEHYENKYEPYVLNKSECLCIICKEIITDDKIYKYKDDPNKGICFNCY